MASNISKLITKILCDNQGCLALEQLYELVQSSSDFKVEDLRSVLYDDGKIAIREGKQQVTGGKKLRPDSLIVAKTSLRLCQKKAGGCLLPLCEDLHLCRYYVCGGCTFGEKCKNPHSLAFSHNAELLKRKGLQDLTEKQLFQLLLQNDPYLLPEICPHYNKGDGPFGSCKFTTSCTKLHACQHFLQGDCKFGSACKRFHITNVQGMKLFQGFGPETLQNLNKIYRNKLIIMSKPERQAAVVSALSNMTIEVKQPRANNPGSPTKAVCPKPISDAERKEICLYNIRAHCSFKEKCARVHGDLPYKWEVVDRDCVTWKDLPNNEEIEKAFCNPSCDTSCMDQPLSLRGIRFPVKSTSKQYVDFETMTYGDSQVRRLSTASSVLHPPHFILTTQWVWYWKGDNGSWKEYGQGDGDVTVSSQTLEKKYLEDRDTEIHFQAGKHQYVLHFKDAAGSLQMYQQNVQYKTKREVRRRPRFVSAQDVKNLRSAPSRSSSSSSTAESVPSHWDKTAISDLGYKLVPLSSSTPDYNAIQKLFKSTMPNSRIISVQRIQNPSLWQIFHWQKEQMQKRNGGKPVDEKYLFHGTDESLVDAICDQNFDWRMCGVHGTAYGKGSYFARDASYSDRYSRARGGQNKVMFVALVLVGEYTKGSSSYVRPPPKKGNSTTLYDSCVDSESNPGIFVIFEKQQIYPEYLIKYV